MTIWFRQQTGPHLEAGCRWPCRRCHAHDANPGSKGPPTPPRDPPRCSLELVTRREDDVKSYKGGRGVLAINQAGSSESIMMLNSMRLFSASFPLAHGSGRALINHR